MKRPESLRAQAVAQIRQAIVSGRLAPGSMHSEQSIAAGMSISRTPVREALLQLATEGLVEFVPQRGVRVTELDAGHLGHVFQFRAAIETYCAAALAAHPRKELLAALDAALGREDDLIASGDHPGWVEANMEFHAILVRSAGNPLLDQAFAGLASHAMRLGHRMEAGKARMRESLAAQRAIVDAIRRRDPERARTLAGELLSVSALLMNEMFSDPEPRQSS